MSDDGQMICEGHLGGFIKGGDPRTYCPSVWDHFIREENVTSMVDVGCGVGITCEHFARAGVDVIGIDGSETAKQLFRVPGQFVLHDYTLGSLEVPSRDFAWSCEFVEHVDEKYVANFMATLRCSRVVAMTHAVPGQPGHHHVNCRPADYWVGTFAAVGFALDEPTTLRLRALAEGTYFGATGLVFRATSR